MRDETKDGMNNMCMSSCLLLLSFFTSRWVNERSSSGQSWIDDHSVLRALIFCLKGQLRSLRNSNNRSSWWGAVTVDVDPLSIRWSPMPHTCLLWLYRVRKAWPVCHVQVYWRCVDITKCFGEDSRDNPKRKRMAVMVTSVNWHWRKGEKEKRKGHEKTDENSLVWCVA